MKVKFLALVAIAMATSVNAVALLVVGNFCKHDVAKPILGSLCPNPPASEVPPPEPELPPPEPELPPPKPEVPPPEPELPPPAPKVPAPALRPLTSTECFQKQVVFSNRQGQSLFCSFVSMLLKTQQPFDEECQKTVSSDPSVIEQANATSLSFSFVKRETPIFSLIFSLKFRDIPDYELSINRIKPSGSVNYNGVDVATFESVARVARVNGTAFTVSAYHLDFPPVVTNEAHIDLLLSADGKEVTATGLQLSAPVTLDGYNNFGSGSWLNLAREHLSSNGKHDGNWLYERERCS
ncbi:hypothetical protein BGW39_009738 [Mortierella sp. 14UC]|nr:hypothetical protein BGW39_009738 [Mortierella sp. 14UC]